MLAQLQLSEGLPLSICPPVHHGAPMPANENARLEALNQLGVLDSDQDQRFDDITALVCSLFNVPIAIVSLVDKERQWFKSCVGLNCSQTDRKSSFCAWTLVPKNPEVLVVPDATEDARCPNVYSLQYCCKHQHHACTMYSDSLTYDACGCLSLQLMPAHRYTAMRHIQQQSVSICHRIIPGTANDGVVDQDVSHVHQHDWQSCCRFQSNPLVLNDPCIRFYAGAPLVTPEGLRLGSL